MSRLVEHIGIYCNGLAGSGGVERVAVTQAGMFSEAGYKVSFISEEEIKNTDNFHLPHKISTFTVSKHEVNQRSEQWKEILLNNSIDIVLYHHAAQENLVDDSQTIKLAGVYLVVTVHFSFLGPFNLIEKWDFNAIAAKNLKDAIVVCLSRSEQLWWQSLGYSSSYIPNPVSNIEIKKNCSEGKIIVWIGRIHPGKQPEHALVAFSKVLPFHPDAKLVMVGDTRSKREMRRLKSLSLRLNIFDSVDFAGRQKDVSLYLAKANFHLLTSINESFGLVITEAKAHGVPTIMYDLPYLELAREGSGLIKAKFCNTDDLAEKMILLLSDPKLRKHLGNMAQNSLINFNNNIVLFGWKKLFSELSKESGSYEIPPSETEILVQSLHESWLQLMKTHHWKIKMFNNLDSLLPYKKDGSSYSYSIVKKILCCFKIKI